MLIAVPKDVTVEANQWAQFNCTVECSYTISVGWYMAGYYHAVKRNNTIPGLLIKRSSESDVKCTLSNEKTYFFEVYATEAFNKSTFYCAAYVKHRLEKNCSCGTDGRCYSRPALLTGEPVCNDGLIVCLKVDSFCLLFILEVLCPLLRNTKKLCYSCVCVVRMAATVNPPTQASVTQTSTPSNCSTSGTLIIQ